MSRKVWTEASGYLLSLALLGPFFSPLTMLGDQLSTVGSLRWRFGILGIAFNQVEYLLLAILVAALWAGYRNHRRTVFGLGVLTAVLAAGFLAATILFALDTVQYRQMLDPSARGTVTVQAAQAALRALLALVVLIGLGLAFFRASRALAPFSRPKGATPLIR